MKTAEQQITDWIIECNFSSYTLQQRLEILNQFKSDAQKHGEQIGWKKGMTDAAEIVKFRHDGTIGKSSGRADIIQRILTARDSTNNL